MLENTLRLMKAEIPNYDEKTGIFYGVVAQNSLNPEVVDDILFGSDTIDLSYEEAIRELNARVEDSLGCLKDLYNLASDIIGPHNPNNGKSEERNLETIRDILNDFKNHRIDNFKETLIEEFNNHYECDNPEFLYEADGHKIIKCLNYDLMIIKSPFYTFAPECSPCVPCAGNIDDINPNREYSKKTYCLDESFYDEENKPKVKIFEVATDKEVNQ
jgi:hypothetical protein